MTPAVLAARKADIFFVLHEYDHQRDAESYGQKAAAMLGVDVGLVFKTLIAKLDGRTLAAAVVPVERTLDLKAFARALGAARGVMADAKEAERATGYVLGGISPLGQRKQLPTVVDRSALDVRRIYVSAGRRGLEIELDPRDLLRVCSAHPADIAR